MEITADIDDELKGELVIVSKRKYRSDVCEAIHSSAEGLFAVGAIDKATMRSFDTSCLVSKPMRPKQIRQLRQKQKVSESVFARYLNTSKATVQRWESGAQRPSGVAQKLLEIVEKHGLEMLA